MMQVRGSTSACSTLGLGLGVCLFLLNSCAQRKHLSGAGGDFIYPPGISEAGVSKEEVAAFGHRQALADSDSDRDEFISKSEWLAKLKPESSSTSDYRFNHLDKNGDGDISTGEAVKYVTDHVQYTKKFGDLDQDHDGYLRHKELMEGDQSIWKITIYSLPWD